MQNQIAQQGNLKAQWLPSQFGNIIAVADEESLYLLEFDQRAGLERELDRLRSTFNTTIDTGMTKPIEMIERELADYFAGKLTEFKTPMNVFGSPFQRRVWQALQRIPHGETRSYAELAAMIDQPTACRAVAQANGANQLAIIIPCHRVINSNGDIGGYGGGVANKKKLLELERKTVCIK